ncbi:hypothetical protein LOZ53_002233 [Ophidiomyces ophidiicola]|nr:hypothetical protein LOZ53_002233 [Ophidiomyces ophidiicola]KAI1995182.1 hypothetical protein LOZ54_000680 [Ophidiomyces ophidiicola]KAI1998759.1 hypothetical protein LOZ51_002497 [Ophidiomyces ophidiicola]
MSGYRVPPKAPWQHDQYHTSSPPRTPPRSANKNSHMPIRPSFPETFLEDIPSVDNNQYEDSADEEKDPHDLSLSPQHVTRTSVVDNMLLSLDQLSESNFNTAEEAQGYKAEEPDPYTLYSRYANAKMSRHRGHTFSSSLSSEIEALDDNSVYPHLSSRGRRSNSSSNFQFIARKPDGSAASKDKLSNRSRVFEAQRAAMGGQLARYPINGGRSETSNLDITQMLAGGRIGRGRRSISFDYGADRPLRQPLDATMLEYDDFNAAPTPNVPAGPRSRSPGLRDHSRPQLCLAESSRTPTLTRKNSAKSAKSMYTKKGRFDTLGTGTVRSRPDDNGRYFRDNDSDIPPIPTRTHGPAPSPAIGFQKPVHISPPAEPITPPTVKERYGFFRRVFGSSKSSSPQSDKTQIFSRDDDNFSRSKEPQSAPNSSKGRPSHNQQSTPIVTKKPSSFFRRRKRSPTDHVPLPLDLLPNLKHSHATGDLQPEPSPSSSLHQAMKPYIAGPTSPRFEDSTPRTKSDANVDSADNEPGTHPLKGRSIIDEPLAATKRAYPSGRSPLSNNATIKKVQASPERNFARLDRDGSFLSSSTGDDNSYQQSSEDVSARPKTSPSPQTSSRNFMPPSNGNEQSSNIASRPNNRLFIDTSLTPPEKSQPESGPTSRAEPNKSMLSAKGAPDSPPLSASTTISHYQTASSTPLISPEDEPISKQAKKMSPSTSPIKESAHETPYSNSSVNTASNENQGTIDRQHAEKLFNDADEQHSKEQLTATWLGNPQRAGLRKAYMDLFDWSDMTILAALRSLCSKMALKGETQQVDRVLDAFSARWCECNPNHGFKATDVVHTICYSLLLLNTDLHLADIEQKMTRTQFIRNTMPTIQRVVDDAAPDSFEMSKFQRPRSIYDTGPFLERSSTPHTEGDEAESNVVSNLAPRPQDTTTKLNPVINLSASNEMPISSAGQLVHLPFRGTRKAWEHQVEMVLKDCYYSIQKRRLPLHGQVEPEEQQPTNNFLTFTGNMLRRTPSTLSRVTASDTLPRGRPADNRLSTARWTSKPRSRARMYPSSTMASSRTSLDDQSVWSPAASSTWSKVSLGKTLTSMSVDSFGSEYPRADYQQSIGFANALSHAIIREDSASCFTGIDDPTRAESLLEDEALELFGAPWAKEGSLKHKHHLDSVDKRAKDRNWNETFGVIQRGWLRLFSFNSTTKSMRLKPKHRHNAGIVVGGGNWMENAEETSKFLLRHTIASALPQPGYSKSRPFVWALSLPTGAVHLFQVGTPEIVKEFVSTANYWSARLSKEPMSGGISNIEYGWSDAVANSSLAQSDEYKPTSASGPRPSLQSSIRSSIDQQSVRPRLPGDRVHIGDWMPPQQSMIASILNEADQLVALRKYVNYVEEELKRHNELRSAMVIAFSPRHPNASKALANWERKSSYLLREIVKFRTYIDCLQTAQTQKEKFLNDAARNEERELDQDHQAHAASGLESMQPNTLN